MNEARRPSASAIERSLACESSAVLPKAPEAPREHNAPSKRGDRIHKALERHGLGGRYEDVIHVLTGDDRVYLGDLDVVLDHKPKLVPIESWPQYEVEFWLDPMVLDARTGTAETPTPPGFWRGRADEIGLYEGVPAVMDYKSGNPRYQVQGDAAQLAYFALCLHLMLGAPRVYGIVYLTQNPLKPRIHLYDEAQLQAWAQKFQEHEARLCLIERGLAEPTLVKSEKNCKWCPVRPICPEWAPLGAAWKVPDAPK